MLWGAADTELLRNCILRKSCHNGQVCSPGGWLPAKNAEECRIKTGGREIIRRFAHAEIFYARCKFVCVRVLDFTVRGDSVAGNGTENVSGRPERQIDRPVCRARQASCGAAFRADRLPHFQSLRAA